MAKEYKFSPFGTFNHPWVNKPDTKFNADGVFKCGLVLGGKDAQSLKETIAAASEAALERFWETEDGKRIPAKERKQWTVYYPFTEEEDDNENLTGYIEFDFKQNAKIKLKDGTVKDVKVGIKDAQNKDVHRPVYSGSEGRVMFTMRDIPMKSLKQVGVRLDMAAVQVTKLQDSSGPGFGTVEGGYSESEQAHAADERDQAGGDY